MLNDKQVLLKKRLEKLAKHMEAITDYKNAIDDISSSKAVYEEDIFSHLPIQEKALFDAYLKRFSSAQDFLGGKVLSLMLELSGVPAKSMTEILYHGVKEGIIDNLENWIELRDVRNELAHDYPDELSDALKDLAFCVEHYKRIKQYYDNALSFVIKHQLLKS